MLPPPLHVGFWGLLRFYLKAPGCCTCETSPPLCFGALAKAAPNMKALEQFHLIKVSLAAVLSQNFPVRKPDVKAAVKL